MGVLIMMKFMVEVCCGSSGNCYVNRENIMLNSSVYVVFVR